MQGAGARDAHPAVRPPCHGACSSCGRPVGTGLEAAECEGAAGGTARGTEPRDPSRPAEAHEPLAPHPLLRAPAAAAHPGSEVARSGHGGRAGEGDSVGRSTRGKTGKLWGWAAARRPAAEGTRLAGEHHAPPAAAAAEAAAAASAVSRRWQHMRPGRGRRATLKRHIHTAVTVRTQSRCSRRQSTYPVHARSGRAPVHSESSLPVGRPRLNEDSREKIKEGGYAGGEAGGAAGRTPIGI